MYMEQKYKLYSIDKHQTIYSTLFFFEARHFKPIPRIEYIYLILVSIAREVTLLWSDQWLDKAIH